MSEKTGFSPEELIAAWNWLRLIDSCKETFMGVPISTGGGLDFLIGSNARVGGIDTANAPYWRNGAEFCADRWPL